jgi:hypothetical protein
VGNFEVMKNLWCAAALQVEGMSQGPDAVDAYLIFI